MGLEDSLGERIAQIDIEREEVLIRLDDIRAKIKRVDEKRSGQHNTSNGKKWTSVLRGLEHDYDKHRRMFAALEAESREKTARLMRERSAFELVRNRTSDIAANGKNSENGNAHLLHSALEKSQQGNISALTFEEVAALLSTFKQRSPQSSDVAVTTMSEEKTMDAMWEIHARCARICADWADLVRHDARAGNV